MKPLATILVMSVVAGFGVGCRNSSVVETELPEGARFQCRCNCYVCTEIGYAPNADDCPDDARRWAPEAPTENCLDEETCSLSEEELLARCLDACQDLRHVVCDARLWDPDEEVVCLESECGESGFTISPLTDSVVTITEGEASASVDGRGGRIDVVGQLKATACSDPPCSFQFNWVNLTSSGTSIQTRFPIPVPPFFVTITNTISEIEAFRTNPMPAALHPDGSFELDPEDAALNVNFFLDGHRGGTMLRPVSVPTGTYRLGTGEFTLTGTWRGDPGTLYEDVVLDLNLTGAFFNRAPVADAGPDQTLECDRPGAALVTLDGSGSYDLDGTTLTYLWSVDGINVGSSAIVETEVALDEAVEATLRLFDPFSEDQDTATVTVVDTTAPEILPQDPLVGVCRGGAQLVHLPVPELDDVCAPDTSTIAGSVIEVHGKVVDPIHLDQGQAFLPLGDVELLWSAVDPSGNESSLAQTLTIETAPGLACCPEGSQPIHGTDERDHLLLTTPQQTDSYCVFALGGRDHVRTGAGSDYIAGGEGDDHLDAGSGNDVVLGEAGNDWIRGGRTRSRQMPGSLHAYGGPGNDSLFGDSGDDVLHGEQGDDLLMGHGGNDVIYPGSGKNLVIAGPGDDRIVFYDACELESGTLLVGGEGQDTLVSPVSVEELQARGVSFVGIELVIVDASQAFLADCF